MDDSGPHLVLQKVYAGAPLMPLFSGLLSAEGCIQGPAYCFIDIIVTLLPGGAGSNQGRVQ